MTVSITDLTKPMTADESLDMLLSLLTLAGLPTTAWQSGGVVDALTQVNAEVIADLTVTVTNIAKGNYGSLASSLSDGAWLDLLMQSQYQEVRKPGVLAKHRVTFTDNGGGPFTLTAGAVIAQSIDGSFFTSTETKTLPKNGTVDVVFQAESVSAAWNVAPRTITSLKTSFPGVAITNLPGSLVQTGTDPESNASAWLRCTQKWATLAPGAPKPLYAYVVSSAAPQITRVNVLENTPSGGKVQVMIAGAAGPFATEPEATNILVAAQGAIEKVRPLCVQTTVVHATPRNITIAGIFTAKAGGIAATQAKVIGNLNAYISALPIGGVVYVATLYEQVMIAAGMVNAVITSPAADVVMTATEAARLFDTSGIAWVSVA